MEVEVGKVGARGQITIPKTMREREGLRSGDYVAIIEEDGRLTIQKLDVEAWAQRVRETEEGRRGPAPSLEEIVEKVHEARESE